MLAPMACLVVMPPICPRSPVLARIRILNHRMGYPRLYTTPELVSRRVRDRSSIPAGSCPGPMAVDIPRERQDAKEGVCRGG
jgi:hypothetical protein